MTIARASIVSLLILLAGCGSNMKAVKPDPISGFPASDPLKPEEILSNEHFDLKAYRHLAYVQVGTKSEAYERFIVQSIKNMGYFEKVLDKQEFEQELISSGKSDSVANISDLIGLRGASRVYGPFLVIAADAEWVGGYHYVSSIKAIDPISGKTVYHATRKAFNWNGLDKPLFYPLFNGFMAWVKANGVTDAGDRKVVP